MPVQASLTIMFEAPFWIGLYERFDQNKYQVCKITFGQEPKDYEVYAFLLDNWDRLPFSPAVNAEGMEPKHLNPKRMHREVSRQLQDRGMGTKAQQALKLQQEQNKTVKKNRNKEQKEAAAERQFALRQEKKKAKHKGR